VPVTFHECVVADFQLESPAVAACGAQRGGSVASRSAGGNKVRRRGTDCGFSGHVPGVLAGGAAPFLLSALRRLAMIERISPIFELIAPNCSFRMLSPR
jgi:hypothetical protein